MREFHDPTVQLFVWLHAYMHEVPGHAGDAA